MSQNFRSLTVAWGLNGLSRVRDRPVCAIVDVLSFSSAVVAGCSRGAVIFPYRWGGQGVEEYARSVGATVAVQRQDSRIASREILPSLSPVSLAQLPPGYCLVLPSPNGSTLAAEAEAEVVLAACLRNASAVADYLNTQEGDVAIIAAGERWPDGSLRVALEDFIGAGAVVARWTGQKCIEAIAAQAVFERFSNDLQGAIRSTASGQELIERGFADDVAFAASTDQSNAVPILVEGAFRLGGE